MDWWNEALPDATLARPGEPRRLDLGRLPALRERLRAAGSPLGTQDGIAKALAAYSPVYARVTSSYVSAWERGSRCPPELPRDLALVLGIPEEILYAPA